MNKKIRIIIGYFLGFCCSILISVLAILLILKFSIYNKEYINNILNKNDYYNKVFIDTKEEMKNYMVSSGFHESILDNIYTDEDIKNDINTYIDNLYLGNKTEVDVSKLIDILNSNIDDYLKKNNLSVINEDDVKSFVVDIASIYEKEVTLYHTFDGFLSSFARLNKIINMSIIIITILIIIIVVIMLKVTKTISLGSSFISASLILLFIRFVIVEKIDIENILLITEYFSDILQIVLLNIRKMLLISSILLIILGCLVFIVSSIWNKKVKVLKMDS